MMLGTEQVKEFEQRALAMWRLAGAQYEMAYQIETLQADTKSIVCRIKSADPNRVSVIAKRSRSQPAMLERTIYQEILPHIPLVTPRFFGVVGEEGGAYHWIFLEDVEDEVCSDTSDEYAILAARWLAIMHTSSTRVSAARCLPARGPDYHFQRLAITRQAMLRRMHDPGVDEKKSEALDNFVRLCDVLYSRWHVIEDFCRDIPWTMVHGDFAAENVHIGHSETSAIMLVFDWEKAGWGMPSIDLPAVNAECYREGISRFWPDLDLDRIRQMQAHGTIWQILSHDLKGKTAKRLSRYQARLLEAMRSADLWQGTL